MAARRCEACGVPLPPAAARCPSCGHQLGDVVTVDIGHGGGGGGNRSRRRDGLLLVGVAVIVVGALVFAGRGGGDPDSAGKEPSSDQSTTTTTTRRPRTTTTSTTSTTTAPVPWLPSGEPTGVKLLVGRVGSYRVVDLDSGTSTDIRGLGDGFQLIASDDGFFVSGSLTPRFFASPYDTPAVVMPGDAEFGGLVESATPGRVWAVSYGPATSVVEIDTTGARTAGPISPPSFGQPIVAADDGLVISLHGAIYTMDVEDGSLRRIGYGTVIAARGSQIAAIGCDSAGVCSLRIIDARTGDIRMIDAPEADFRDLYYSAAFSPDGHMLALAGNGPVEMSETETLIVDVQRGTVDVLNAGRRLEFCCGVSVSWSRDSEWMFWVDGDSVFALKRGTSEPIAIQLGRPPLTYVAVVG